MSHRAAVSLTTLLLAAALSTTGCQSSSGTGLVDMPEPAVLIAQTSKVASAARHETGASPVQLLVQITNNASRPITLKRVQAQSVGSGAYTITEGMSDISAHPFDVLIPPTATRTVSFWVAATANDTIVGANGPVTLRLTASFDSPAGKFRSITVQQVHDSLGSD
jgi:hypothetical protein